MILGRFRNTLEKNTSIRSFWSDVKLTTARP